MNSDTKAGDKFLIQSTVHEGAEFYENVLRIIKPIEEELCKYLASHELADTLVITALSHDQLSILASKKNFILEQQ